MNWLAHSLLSPNVREVRMGNVLADLIPKEDQPFLSESMRAGIRDHYRIDSFTDAHPIVRAGHRRFESAAKRYAGPILDVFFDHFLCVDWDAYSPVPLSDYLAELYEDLTLTALDLKGFPTEVIPRLIGEDWMGAYRSVDGIDLTLKRMSRRVQYRTGRDIDLSTATADLQRCYTEFQQDFREFFPQLVTWMKSPEPSPHHSDI